MTLLSADREAAGVLDLPGLEADNLLGFLALLGLLRALESARPTWRPRAAWTGPPWLARLYLAASADQEEVARAAAQGVEALALRFDVDGRANVDFDRNGYRGYAERVRGDPVNAALAATLTAEFPPKRSGDGLQASPLVMMFGQGWQNFLARLVAISRGELPNRLKKLKPPPDMRDPAKIAEALFAPWMRTGDADGFRWDPAEDQRYALRFGDPSKDGAALTVHGANRLAAIGFLSFPSAPGRARMGTTAAVRREDGFRFIWPIWREPLSRGAVEMMLGHPGVASLQLSTLRAYGVVELLVARRIANGKFMNVTRARPASGEG